jgi:NodT family efflux transporter outer membrane factor (OMF) lipoprotein
MQTADSRIGDWRLATSHRRLPIDCRLSIGHWRLAIGAAAVLLAIIGSGCATGGAPLPQAAPQVPPAFRESADWKPGQPADQLRRGAWWEVFGDPQLDALQATIDVSNDTLRGAQARFLQARAAVGINRASRYPQISTTPQITTGTESGNRTNATGHERVSDFLLPVDVSYEADVWGRVRLGVASAVATAQASAADLEAVRLSLHAELALDYFELRGLDAERVILDNSVTAFQRALELTRNRFAGGIASQADVALAETQLESTRAQAVDLGARRAALEHAMAVLTGKPPTALQLPSSPLANPPPEIPMGLPSDLLERRPDIAAAERRIAAAGAEVGIAQAAFFPRLFLTATAGFQSRSLSSWLSGLSTFWSAGPALATMLIDGGRRHAVSDQARAGYDETVAFYQETILRSLQEVEDSLATLRVLREEADIQAAAVAAAERSVTLATNRYRGGVTSYLEVIAAQSAALNNQRAAVSILSRRLAASVLLIKALGGGWTAAALPVIKSDTPR